MKCLFIACLIIFSSLLCLAGDSLKTEKDTLAISNDSIGTLIINMIEFENNDGQARVSLFISADGFPDQTEKAFHRKIAQISDKKSQAIFNDLTYGIYAVSVFHDENADGELDTGLFGIAREGYGASNNPRRLFGLPRFKDARFELNSDTLAIEIKMDY